MKTIYKVLISLSIGICLIVAGISLGGLSQINFGGFWGGLNFVWGAERINDVDYQAQGVIEEMNINLVNGEIEFIEGDFEQMRVEASQVYEGFEIYQDGNTLRIEQAHSWPWVRNRESADIKIYLPNNKPLDYAKINVAAGNVKVYDLKCQEAHFQVGAGNLKIDGVDAQEMEVKVGMGNAKGQDITITEKLGVDVGLGSAKMSLTGNEEEYNYKMKVGLGSIRVGHDKEAILGHSQSNHGTTSKLIDVNCGLGSVKVEMEG